LILGPHLRDSNHRFEQIELMLRQLGEGFRKNLEAVGAEGSRLMDNAMLSIEKKLRACDSRASEERIALQQRDEQLAEKLGADVARLETGLAKLSVGLHSLGEELESVRTALGKDLATVQGTPKEDLRAATTQFLDELNTHSRFVRDTRVSKDDIAEILIELGMRVKGLDVVAAVPQLAAPATVTPRGSDPPQSAAAKRPEPETPFTRQPSRESPRRADSAASRRRRR
jgi:hypothetical protein